MGDLIIIWAVLFIAGVITLAVVFLIIMAITALQERD